MILLSASNRTALITLWTASWCPSCRIVAPLIRQLIEEEGAGEERGGVGYTEIEFDSPTLGDVAGRYGLGTISSILGRNFFCILTETQIHGAWSLENLLRVHNEGQTLMSAYRLRVSQRYWPSADRKRSYKRGLPMSRK